MPWKEVSTMSLREEFVMLASQEGSNRRALCRRFGISAKTGYKWLCRFEAEGRAGLMDRSRRPLQSPRRSAPEIEAKVVALRGEHPAWGARKLARRLRDRGECEVPAPSTITAILKRHELIDAAGPAAHPPWRRFEHPYPNAFWQMDFKGHFALTQGRCHPLTVLDDHARFNLTLAACADQRGATVKARLTDTFRRYGMPERIGVDNGSPWGQDFAHTLTPLTVWLLHIGIQVTHSRPYHPQTLGKDERFHRSFKAEVLAAHTFGDLAECQWRFDRWRDVYNLERPHEALEMAVPASRYQPSPRPFPETLPPIEYDANAIVRKVQDHGQVFYKGREVRIPKALRGYPIALHPTGDSGYMSVYFRHHEVAQINLNHPYK
jgi:transposase InsO family protein